MTVEQPLLEMSSICKELQAVRVLDSVNMSLGNGEIRGIVGQNGAGKSTLMKILAGVHEPTSGAIHLRGQAVRMNTPGRAHSLGIQMVFQEFSLVPTLSIVDNVMLGRAPTKGPLLDKREALRRTGEAFARLGVEFELGRKVGELGVGDRQIVEVGKAIAQNPTLLVLDEPTASSAETEISLLFNANSSAPRRQGSVSFTSRITWMRSRDYATLSRFFGMAQSSVTGRLKGSGYPTWSR